MILIFSKHGIILLQFIPAIYRNSELSDYLYLFYVFSIKIQVKLVKFTKTKLMSNCKN